MASLIDKRLIFVTGKGGVGKSTVSAALGKAAVKLGKRTIICEVAQQERMSRYFHREGIGFNEVELDENLFAISIDPDKSMEEYLRLQVKVKPVADLLFSNKVFHYFAAATPGMKELVTVGKIWELAQLDRRLKKTSPYDLVIVDAPATGHGIGLLHSPKMFADVARVGPINRQGNAIHNFVTDVKKTGVVAVALPEEMPVNETIELEEKLEVDMGIALDMIFVNGLYPKRFSGSEVDKLQLQLEQMEAGGKPLNSQQSVVRATLRAALSEARRASSQRSQLRRLKRRSVAPVSELPFLFEPEFDVEHFNSLAKSLEASL